MPGSYNLRDIASTLQANGLNVEAQQAGLYKVSVLGSNDSTLVSFNEFLKEWSVTDDVHGNKQHKTEQTLVDDVKNRLLA